MSIFPLSYDGGDEADPKTTSNDEQTRREYAITDKVGDAISGTDHGSLLPLTAALLECVTPVEVVDVILGRGVSLLGAEAGLVVLARDQGVGSGHLEIVG